ncbi:MAG: galactokinase, partial [Mongoliibacter sp.]
NIVHKVYIDEFQEKINSDFYKSFGKKPEFYQVSLEDGTGIL